MIMSGFPAMTLGEEACKTTTPAWQSMNQLVISLATNSGRSLELPVRIANETTELRGGYQWLCAETIQNSAILFVMTSTRITRFHMNHVSAPLDILYFDDNGRILESLEMIRENLGIPDRFKTYAPNQAFKYALELPSSPFSRTLAQANGLHLTIKSIGKVHNSP